MASNDTIVGWLSRAFGNKIYSDLTIHCGDRTWLAHRVIVCGQSPPLEAQCALHGGDAFPRVIKLDQDDTAVVHGMLRHMYTETIASGDGATSVDQGLEMNVRVHAIAVKYNIPSLAEHAVKRFVTQSAAKWDTEDFARAIEAMYSVGGSTKEAMWKSAVQTAAKHARKLYRDDYGAHFRQVADDVPAFGSAVAAQILQDIPNEEARVSIRVTGTHQCPGCRAEVDMERVPWSLDGRANCSSCRRDYFQSEWEGHGRIWDRHGHGHRVAANQTDFFGDLGYTIS